MFLLRATLPALTFLAAASPLAAAPVMFVTQTPHSDDFTTILATFGNHRGTVNSAPRGGDLYIRYDNGTLRNLTQEAGYGTTALQEITVRDPSLHWSGTKALFSMAIGGTTQNNYTPVYFQIYEVTGLGQSDTVVITKLPQPEDYNNVTPIYGTDDRIIFTSDRPVSGNRDLYPQLDEYESSPTNTGLWRMNPDGTGLEILDHCPSGDFHPMIDSFGRVIFTRWDHMQRDQQADADISSIIDGDDAPYEANTYDSEEDMTSTPLAPGDEVFPEQRYLYGGGTPHPQWDAGHYATERDLRFNQFVPWMVNEDGSDLEVLNHLGRHELFSYIQSGRTYLPDHNGFDTRVTSFMIPREDPTQPGHYYGIDGPEFATHGSGQIVLIEAPPSANPDDITPEYITHVEGRSFVEDSETPSADHPGFFRDPMPRSDGTLWASHSDSPYADDNTLTDPGSPNPYPLSSRYNYRIRQLVDGPGGVKVPGPYLLASSITKSVTYFDNYRYRTMTYNGPMWELSPVEVVARTRPAMREAHLPAIEQTILLEELGDQETVDLLKDWMVDQNLALVVSRDVTVRGDRQQDYRLKVAWSTHETTDGVGTPKEIGYLQFFEGLQRRGYGTRTGRRVIATEMRSDINPPDLSAPAGGVRIGDDGSMAAFVPAGRALSWQTTEPDGTPSVRERYWLTFAAGEIRACSNCHGLNNDDVFGDPIPTNEPQAFRDLLQWWQTNNGGSRVSDWKTIE